MKRLAAITVALSLGIALAAPAMAADFPEQADIHACEVVQSLPKDIIAQLYIVSPGAAEILLANLIDACNL